MVATIITADIDPLASDGLLLTEKLRAAGVKVTYQPYEGVTHEFFGADAVLQRAQIAQREMCEELRAAFAAVPAPVTPPEPVTIRRRARGQRSAQR